MTFSNCLFKFLLYSCYYFCQRCKYEIFKIVGPFGTKVKIRVKERSIRLRIPEYVYKKYKIICIEKDLSLPKQTTELIRKFVEIDETNKKLTAHLK